MAAEIAPTERLRRGETFIRQTGRGECVVFMLDAGTPDERLVLSFRPFKRCRWAYRAFTKHFKPNMLGYVLGYVTRTVGNPPTKVERWQDASA